MWRMEDGVRVLCRTYTEPVDGGTGAHLLAQFAVSAVAELSDGRDADLVEGDAAAMLDSAGADSIARLRRARVLASVNLAADHPVGV